MALSGLDDSSSSCDDSLLRFGPHDELQTKDLQRNEYRPGDSDVVWGVFSKPVRRYQCGRLKSISRRLSGYAWRFDFNEGRAPALPRSCWAAGDSARSFATVGLRFPSCAFRQRGSGARTGGNLIECATPGFWPHVGVPGKHGGRVSKPGQPRDAFSRRGSVMPKLIPGCRVGVSGLGLRDRLLG